MGDPPRTPGKEDKEDKDGGRYASPNQRRAFEEGRALYGDECHRCNQRGHWQAECPMRWQSNNMVCNHCGSTEHSQYNCPEVARANTEVATEVQNDNGEEQEEESSSDDDKKPAAIEDSEDGEKSTAAEDEGGGGEEEKDDTEDPYIVGSRILLRYLLHDVNNDDVK